MIKYFKLKSGMSQQAKKNKLKWDVLASEVEIF